MSLIKKHPTVEVILPEFAYPGETVHATVHVDAEDELPVSSIQCNLLGRETVRYQNRSRENTLVKASEQLMGEGSLASGRTTFELDFELPSDLPPTHDFGQAVAKASIAYRVEVLVDIPWWPDLEKTFVLVVRLPPENVRDEGPSLYASRPDGPVDTEPYVEFTITAHSYAPGETLEGALSVGNARYNSYHDATLRLVGYEHLRARGIDRRIWRVGYDTDWDISDLVDGEPLAFAMTLPEDVTPSFTSKLCVLEWRFEIELGVHGKTNFVAMVPVTMLPAGSVCERVEATEVIAVGGGRTALLWQGVAEELGMTFVPKHTALEARRGEVGIRIRRRHFAREGLCLVAELAYPSLGLRLSEASEPAQVAAFNAALDEVFPNATALVDALEDERLEVMRYDSGQIREPLVAFARDVLALADAVPAGRRAIPPPAAMADHVDAWQRVAASLRGQLRVADMAIFGRFEGAEVEVLTRWEPDGEPGFTTFVYRDANIVGESKRFRWEGDASVEGNVDGLSDATLALLKRIAAEARTIEVEMDHIVLEDARAPIADTNIIHTRLEELSRLAAALRGKSGPYR